jgi:HSP20 family molecular chaperone IbpA
MTDRRNFFEKLGRSLQLEDEQYPEANLTEQDFLKAQEVTEEPQETLEPEQEPQYAPQELPAEEPLMPAEVPMAPIEEPDEPVLSPDEVTTSLASVSVARKRVAPKAPARRVAPRAVAKKPATSKNGVEGRLTIDVYETDTEIVVKSTVAGVDPSELDINITPDSISIRGSRTQEEKVSSDSYFYQECFWGAFSRSVILPTEIDPDHAKASLKKGVLTIRLPKLSRSEERKLVIDSE